MLCVSLISTWWIQRFVIFVEVYVVGGKLNLTFSFGLFLIQISMECVDFILNPFIPHLFELQIWKEKWGGGGGGGRKVAGSGLITVSSRELHQLRSRLAV